MSSPKSELPMRAHPFRRKCVEALDTYGREVAFGLWVMQRDGWEIVCDSVDLIFRNQSWQGGLITVWSDVAKRPGQQVKDLTPYEEMLDRWMVLERLAEI